MNELFKIYNMHIQNKMDRSDAKLERMVTKGFARPRTGKQPANAKITPALREQLIQDWTDGMSRADLAKKYGISEESTKKYTRYIVQARGPK